MRRYRFTYFLGQSIKGLWRNALMTVASITVLFSCLIVMGSFTLLIMNIDTNLEKLGLLNEIVVFIDFEKNKENEEQANSAGMLTSDSTSADSDSADSAPVETETEAVTDGAETGVETGAETEPEVEDIPLTREEEIARLAVVESRIRQLSGVSEVTLVKKEQALEEEAKKYEEYEDLYAYFADDNPLRDSFIIKYKDGTDLGTLRFNLDEIDEIDNINIRQDLANKIDSVKGGISTVLLIFLAILFIVSIFVIINTIKLALHSRRAEITIMRYIGATDWFIMLPFLMEGIIIGLLSSVMAFAVQWVLYDVYVVENLRESLSFLQILGFSEAAPVIGIAFVGIGVLTGIIGSIISTIKYLKV